MRRGKVYELLYSRWSRAPAEREPGYTLLLLIPGDLPVFLRLAMEVCGAQDAEHRVETVVLPDIATDGFARAFERYRKSWQGGPIRVAPLGPVEGVMTRWRKNPHLNCWLQFVTGIDESRTTHAIWHDSDLFLGEPDFLRRHYEAISDRKLALLGLSEAWDDTFRREHGREHMVSTWELAFDVDWARSFKPWEHRGHDGELDGRPITYDITFWPQTRTPPERIALAADEPPFVHFNHTIGTYRNFQRALRGGEPFEDSGFRVLLVRLLADLLDDSDWDYEAPAAADLLRGVEDPSATVTFRSDEARETYPEFRAQLAGLIGSGFLSEERSHALARAIEPWDAAFGAP